MRDTPAYETAMAISMHVMDATETATKHGDFGAGNIYVATVRTDVSDATGHNDNQCHGEAEHSRFNIWHFVHGILPIAEDLKSLKPARFARPATHDIAPLLS
jgi:hypothetical protein